MIGSSAPMKATVDAVGRDRRVAVGPGLLRQRPDRAVERHDVEVLAQVAVPALVARRARDDARGVGQPRHAVVLVRPGRQVAHGAGAVGGHDVDVLRAVEHPALVVEAGEERLDLARRLPALVLGLVAGIAGAAGERQPLAVGRPGDVGDAVGHRDDRAHLAGAVDGQDVQRRLLVLLAAPRAERQPAAVGRPHRAGVVGAGRDRRRVTVRPGQPDPRRRACSRRGRSSPR